MSIRHYISKFALMTWKLHKSQWNRPIELLWVILVPVLLCLIAVGMRMCVGQPESYNAYYDPIDIEQCWTDLMKSLSERQDLSKKLNKSNNVFIPQMVLAWAPNQYNIFHKIMDLAIKDLHSMGTRDFRDCSEMERAVKNDYLFAGICFDQRQFVKIYSFRDHHLKQEEVLMPHFNYTLFFPSELRMFHDTFIGDNWKTLYHDDPKISIVRRLNDASLDGHISYVREGFIKIQMAISETYIKVMSHSQLPKIVLRRFPVDGRIQDPLMNYVNRGLPLLIIIGFLFPAQILVWQIVEEKQRHLRRFLINMNISNLIQFTSWYFKGLVYMFISSILIVLSVKVPWNSNRTLLTQTPCQFAVRVVTVLWLLTYMPFFVLWNNREKSVLLIRYISCAFPNTVVALLFEGLMEREIFFGQQWLDSGYILNSAVNQITVYHGVWIFLIDTLVYCAIGLYMEVWNSTETGGRRRKHIPAPLHSGDFSFPDREDSTHPQISQPGGIKSTKIYEVEPSHRRFKIKIKKICQRYANNKNSSLNFFSLNVYENEVTVLMGHNGCGKTTLLQILANLLEPSRGVVLVSEKNTQIDGHNASMQIGLALGDDLLFRDLTVTDQIRFICMIKGMSWKKANEEIAFYLQLFRLTHAKLSKIKSLTAPERNLVSIACAFAGGSPIVLIDDLHSDLDLVTQSLICSLINEEKSRRTIILVSNSTSLANHLADRLAIMSQGELKCTGSKPFLRSMYGHGFRLSCIKGKTFDFVNLKLLLAKYLPNLTVESDIGQKITFVLETKYEDRFAKLFDELEQNLEQLGILSFRLRDTSLDEIFMRFGSEDNEVTGEPSTLIDDLRMVLEESDVNGRANGLKRTRMHLWALLKMRWLINRRHLPIQIVNVFALIVALACTFSTLLLYGKDYQLDPLSFNLTQLTSVNAFVEYISDTLDMIEMQEFFTELLFWYDGHVQELETAEPTDLYLLQQEEFNKIVNFRYMFGATFGKDTITVWYNNIPLHAAPFGLNLVHNVIARHFYDEDATIDVTLYPLPFQVMANAMPPTPLSLGGMMAINFSFIFANMWQSMTVFNMLEHSFKNQQFLTGVRLSTYIFCLVIFDIARVVLVSIGMVIMMSFYLSPQHDIYLYMWIFLMLIMMGLAVATLSYCFSTIFKESNNAFIAITFLNALGIIIFTVTVGDHMADMNDLYQPLTQYSFGEIVFKLFFMYEYECLCKDDNIRFISIEVENCAVNPHCCISYSYVKGNFGLIFDMIMMICSICVPLIIFVLREYYSLMAWTFMNRGISKKKHRARHEGLGDDMGDESVIAERLRIDKLTKQERADTAAICQNVGKRFGKKRVLVRIDLCVSRAECIGFMGYNNTGKTTLIKTLVGEMHPSHGRIWIGGHSRKQQRIECYPLVGYCAQQHVLPCELTPRELLHTQANLHGLPKQSCSQICEGLASVLGFYVCYKQLMRLCTTGQHRRIAFALAILGDPRLVCVDGPPGGIDPNGKRIMYIVTTFMQQRGCSFLYTNLTGLDCERMCHRCPVLHDGQLSAMGSQAQRYKSGYLLEVVFKRKVSADINTARNTWDRINKFPVSPPNKFILFVQIKFPEAKLQQKRENIMTFYLPADSTNFSEILLTIRRDAFELNIEDFYITCNIVMGMQTDLFDRSVLKTAPPHN
ncbi:ATP-binding cassette sub-family A member 17 isoform X2 [Drosophila grimshawi]|uniref:ATP-binding cassette sub-family A member 17 isoform X2 n=1 Tax=Drosophila grimshawi TaxID=7222 RepID=UPI000C86EC9E|nr:ATP-binding cassette sub-family A member 17 isoform X2 [Drosophila grimshawi]